MKRWLILAEGESAGQFDPLDQTRPCFGIRDGAFTNAERWITLLKPVAVTVEIRESVATVARELFTRLADGRPDEIWTIEGMVQPRSDPMWQRTSIADFEWTSRRCRVTKVSSKPQSKTPTPQALPLRALDGPWNIIEHLVEQLAFDFALWKRRYGASIRKPHAPSKGVFVIGDPKSLWVGRSAKIHPQNVLNTETGPIILDQDVVLEPFNRIDGPAYIGSGTSLLGGKFTGGTALGPGCKIGGEWEASIAQGFVNKAHAGFFGHGILGEWVNLGAMTTNSDLKNNYGTVRVNRSGGDVETGLIKVGSFFADHCKTGIGTLIPTGATWGVGVNYFGGDLAPKSLPPFVWGDRNNLAEHRLEQMTKTANVAMKRRAETLEHLGRRDHLSDSERSLLTELFSASKSIREEFLKQRIR